MSPTLILVSRNLNPKRELYHPDLWIIHTAGECPVEVRLWNAVSTETEWIPLEALDRSLT
jgi:hypothetical protein